MRSCKIFDSLIVIGAIFFLSGCAFNVISIRQTPTTFVSETSGESLVLSVETQVPLVEGSSRKLRSGTTWQKVGHVNEGDVYVTSDQVITVVASHEHEAQLVVKDGEIQGFYLLVEHTFTPASEILPFQVKPK